MKKSRKNKNNDEPCSFKDFMLLFPECNEDVQIQLIERLRQQPRPYKICGKEVPETLNHLSYGTLDDLRNAASTDNAITECISILVGVEQEELLDEDINVIYGFLNFVSKELEKINNLFKNIHHSYSPEEEAAGVRELDFGSFGILDWYARRMGITNQNEVRDVAWVRIYQCMKNDNQKYEYERRLQKVYERKHQNHNKKRR